MDLEPRSPSATSASPDPEATGSPERLRTRYVPDEHERDTPTREMQEREAAWQRGRERKARGEAGHDPEFGRASVELAHRAFAALAENVRDYAIFLMDANGIIRFWGEGAHLLKRWTKEEAEGAHIRALYLDGGSEDGTAEAHLLQAAEQGEYVGEGQRVRSDGTTFWARVTLTALRDAQATLIGFTKVTVDLTAQRTADLSRLLRQRESELARTKAERADLAAESEVLREEVEVLRRELSGRDRLSTGSSEPEHREGA